MLLLKQRGNRAAMRLTSVSIVLTCLSLGAPSYAETLSMTEAMVRAAKADPALVANRQRANAAEANIRQAGYKPNPSFSLEAENILGSGAYNGLDRAETTLSYQTPLERRAKREARTGVAMAERDLTLAKARGRIFAVMSEAQTLWIEALVSEAEARLADERLQMAERSQAEIKRRVNAARDPLFAGSLAKADVAAARIARDHARAMAQQFKQQLCALWGGTADFDLDPVWLEDTGSAVMADALSDTPEIEALRAQQRVAAAQVRTETARRAQDPVASVGVRHFRADGSVAVIVGGAIPLEVNDTNRGNIERARAEAEAAASDIEAAERQRQREIAASSIRLTALAEDARRTGAEVVPQAETAVTQVREGFARGGFSYRDVLGAQDALIAAKARKLQALKAFHMERIRRDRLSGHWMTLIASVEGVAQ